jgi:F-type H+-transporting ATPase subunit c
MFRRTWMYVMVAIGMLLATPLGAMAQEAAAGGCGIGQGRLGASAMESIGRNPNSTSQLFVPMIIGFAFVESLTLYSLVISFLLLGKL